LEWRKFGVLILSVDEPSDGLGQLIDELVFGSGVESRKPLGFRHEPEPVDGVEIGWAGGQKPRLAVTSIE